MKKYLQYSLFLLIAATSFTSCSKDTASAETDLAASKLADKTWYLDYQIITTATTTQTKTYVGQSTYFVNFLKNMNTNDSDGITGTYSVEKIGNQLQIHVQAKTNNATPIEIIYNIESIGSKNMILSSSTATATTKYYYSNK